MRVDQLLPSLAAGDAISGHAMEIRAALRASGVQSDLHVLAPGAVIPSGAELRPLEALGDLSEDDAVLYHLSLGSPVTNRFLAGPGRKAVVYHNITPPRFFEGWDPPMVEVLARGVDDLTRCAPACQLGIGDSDYNRRQLQRVGFQRTAVLPILVDPSPLTGAADPVLAIELADRQQRGRIWLFVGRFVPNKCQHDVVKAFAAYRRKADPEATLLLIGSAFTGTYRDAVVELATQLSVGDAVIARGPLTAQELAACYQAADVFVCLSEHEGFCVPLVEAMAAGIPVVGYAAAAVPETAADAAILVDDKDPVLVGATVAELLSDDATRREMVQRGVARAHALSPDEVRPILLGLVKELLA